MSATSLKKEQTIRLIRGPLAILIWLYFFVKLFIFDIDVYFVGTIFPQGDLILKYKFVLILLIAAISWLILGSKQFLLTLGFILSYPLILTLWKLPKKLFGSSTNVVFTFIASVILTFQSGKTWFISFAFFLAACTAIFLDFGIVPTICSMIFLFALLCKHLFERFRTAFKPENILSAINKYLKYEWATQRQSTFEEFRDSTKYPPNSDAFLKKKAETIANLMNFNNLFRLIAYKLKDFQESRILVVYSIVRLVYTFIMTVVIFALEYFPLHRMMPDSFTAPKTTTIFTYLYLSFNTIRGSAIMDLIPSTTLAKLLTSLETVFGMSIFVILFFFFTTIMKQKYEEELKELILALETESLNLRKLLIAEFSTPEEEIDKKYTDFLLTFKIKNKDA